MVRVTNRERVLAALAASSHPLDDDELSGRTGIKPRQSVNQICRRLEAEGLVVRASGATGKIVNALTNAPRTADMGPSTTVIAGPPAAGSSAEQRAAESLMLAVLSEQLGVALAPRRVNHPSGARVEVDGADQELSVLVECWAHQGPAKVAQKYKIVNDAVKLHWIAASLPPRPRRLIICVSDEAAVAHLRGRSWQGQAIAGLGVELSVVRLPPETVAAITAAQVRQYR